MANICKSLTKTLDPVKKLVQASFFITMLKNNQNNRIWLSFFLCCYKILRDLLGFLASATYIMNLTVTTGYI